MAKLSPPIVAATRQVAESAGIPAAFLLTVVEVETAGQAFEADGHTPRLLFERHKFFANLPKGKLPAAVKAGLAIPKWLGPGSSQYADQKTSRGRLDLMVRASAIHEESAWRSCSMGLPQLMGSNYAVAGYASAVEMRDEFASLVAQVSAGVAFMRANGLLTKLLAKDWHGFARGYNGKAYRKNGYHTKLAAAFAKWNAPGALSPRPAGALSVGDSGGRVQALQAALKAKGFRTEAPNGEFSANTQRQVFAAQATLVANGTYGASEVTGVVTDADVAAIEALPEVDRGAKEAVTLKEARKLVPAVGLMARAKAGFWGVLALLGVGGAQDSDPASAVAAVSERIDSVRSTADAAFAAKDAVLSAVDWGVAHWPLAVAAAAILFAYAVVHRAEIAAYCGWKESA